MIPSWIEGTFIHNAGGRLFDEAATRTLITEQPFVDAVQWLADLIHVNGVAVVDSWDHQWFLTNRAGMMHNAAWMMGMLNETDVRYDLAPLFYTGEHRPHNSPSGDTIAILKDSPNIDAAWRFVRFMVSPEGLRHFTAGVPVHREVAQEYGRGVDRPSNMAAFVYETATKMAVFYPADIPAEATDPIWQATSRVYAGEVPASVALREVAGVVDAVLAEWRARSGGRRRWKHPKWPFDWWCSTGAHLVSVGAMEPEVLGAPSGGAKTHSQGEGGIAINATALHQMRERLKSQRNQPVATTAKKTTELRSMARRR